MIRDMRRIVGIIRWIGSSNKPDLKDQTVRNNGMVLSLFVPGGRHCGYLISAVFLAIVIQVSRYRLNSL